jgi:hypothetical protein
MNEMAEVSKEKPSVSDGFSCNTLYADFFFNDLLSSVVSAIRTICGDTLQLHRNVNNWPV